MKIVCDACQAKYSISDDKVQGKVFKIRCKKCSNIIVVRGGANAAEAAPAPQEKDTRVYDYGYDGAPGGGDAGGGDDAVWHLVINQDQVGPMSVGEVQQRFASGEVDGETFAWREGFADWLPLAQVDVFAALITSGSTTSAHGGGGAAAIGAMFGSGDDGGGNTRNDDLFSAASARGGHHDEDDGGGGDLFGGKPAAAAASSASAASSKLRGERNENSVLFSLNNLAQLASDKPAISTPSSQSSGHATGAAGGEGSGLIDIRSMASAYMGGGASIGKPATSSAIGSIDDLPVFGGGGFSEPAVIVPSVGRGRDNKLLYLMIGAVSLLAVVAIVMIVMLMKSGKKETTVASAEPPKTDSADKDNKANADKPDTANTGSAAQVAAADTGSAAKADSTPTTPPTSTTPTKSTTPTPSTTTTTQHKTTPSTTSSSPSTTTSHSSSSNSSPGVAKTTPKTDPTPPPPAKTTDSGGGGCDEVSCVINSYAGACCAKFHKGGGGGGGGGGGAAPKPAGNSDLPDSLDRGMISSAIANVKARVTACGEKSSAKGKVKVHVKVGGDGHVSSVNVETTPDPGLGSCVQAAVQKATFAKTQNGGSFSYPFVF